MKFAFCNSLLLAVLMIGGDTARLAGDKTITQVVKLLQGMLDQSKADGDSEHTAYAKYVCGCDKFKEETEATIDAKTTEIALLGSEIEKLQADNSKLSEESAQLVADMAANKERQEAATSMRTKENGEYTALKTDLEGAIGQLNEAIATLTEIAGDQTVATGADHKQFLANYKPASLITKLKAQVKTALTAAVAFVPNAKRRTVLKLLQKAPFTGTYTAQAPEVVGILKDMLDTFSSNLAAATETEAKALAAYTKLMASLEASWNSMNALNQEKQDTLAANDEALASKKGSLDAAITDKADAESALAESISNCDKYSKAYTERRTLRANEEAAIAEAIAILDSDAAFGTFGTVDATSTGSAGPGFLQLTRSSARSTDAAQARNRIEDILQKVSNPKKSMKVAKVIALLRAGNPFDTVLEEISKMLDIIKAEGVQDQDNLDFCNSARSENDASIAQKESEIIQLTSSAESLTDTIENEETGLKKQLEENAESLKQNTDEQAAQTKARTEANVAYQKDIKNLVDAEDLLENAIGVLKNYYTMLEKKLSGNLLQKMKKAHASQPTAPDFLKAEYSGQSYSGKKGTDAVTMLEYILEETKKEESTAHSDEAAAQEAYESSMESLTGAERSLRSSRITLEKNLADAEKSLLMTKENLKKTEAEKKSMEDYLASIKPGCDFITTNIDIRKANRAEEKQSLETAIGLIKGTPAYIAATEAAHQESLGKCATICNTDGEDQATCKACLADVTVPGYCAGHEGTPGC